MTCIFSRRFFAAGGFNDEGEYESGLYVFTSGGGGGQWTSEGDMPLGGREDLACGVAKEEDGVPTTLVIAGGKGPGVSGHEVELYDLNSGQWKVAGNRSCMTNMLLGDRLRLV